jgi:hypothetical protein
MVDHTLQIIEEAVVVRRIDVVVIPQTRPPDALGPTVVGQPDATVLIQRGQATSAAGRFAARESPAVGRNDCTAGTGDGR